MMAKITATEIMINGFVTGMFNVVASVTIKCHVDYVEPRCSFAVKVN